MNSAPTKVQFLEGLRVGDRRWSGNSTKRGQKKVHTTRDAFTGGETRCQAIVRAAQAALGRACHWHRRGVVDRGGPNALHELAPPASGTDAARPAVRQERTVPL